jgi:elongation factor G
VRRHFGPPRHGPRAAVFDRRQQIITATELRGGATVLTAEAPLASMFGYSAAVRSVSQGRASFTMAPLKYGPAPAETAEAYT